jgi:hypothetical protein
VRATPSVRNQARAYVMLPGPCYISTTMAEVECLFRLDRASLQDPQQPAHHGRPEIVGGVRLPPSDPKSSLRNAAVARCSAALERIHWGWRP